MEAKLEHKGRSLRLWETGERDRREKEKEEINTRTERNNNKKEIVFTLIQTQEKHSRKNGLKKEKTMSTSGHISAVTDREWADRAQMHAD